MKSILKTGTHRHLNIGIIFLLSGMFFSVGCHQTKEKSEKPANSIVISQAAFDASCPYLTHDAEGNSVLSWVQKDSANGMPMVYYAVFSDSSNTFGVPHPVPTSKGVEPHGENMPKIIFQNNHNIWVVFSIKNPHSGNPYTGAVYYTRSSDQGTHWTPAQPLINDTSISYDQRYFDVALLPDGEIGLVWLNNSKPIGSTLYFASTQGNKGFSNDKVIGSHTCQCCRTDILVGDSGKINVAWRDIYHDSIRDMFYCYSLDTGRTFSTPVRISPDNWVVNGCPHTGPAMAVNKNGLHFTWFTMGGGGGVYYCQTTNGGMSFSARKPVSELPSARHPQIASLPDNDLAIVWDEGIKYRKGINQHIGLQMRGPTGLLLSTDSLTPDSINATFPQLNVLDNQKAILAYTQDKGAQQEVRYKIVKL